MEHSTDIIIHDKELFFGFRIEKHNKYLKLCRYYIDLDQYNYKNSIKIRFLYYKPIKIIDFDKKILNFKGEKRNYVFNIEDMIESNLFSFNTKTKIIGEYPWIKSLLIDYVEQC